MSTATDRRRAVVHRLDAGVVPALVPAVGRVAGQLFGAQLLAVLEERRAQRAAAGAAVAVAAGAGGPALRVLEGGGGGAARAAE
jgi:hypothetical protein